MLISWQGAVTTQATTPAIDEYLKLDNQLCFALYAATRAVTKIYMERLGPLDLTYPQYLVLLVLWEHDGSTISEIGRRLMLDSGTLTPVVKRLEGMGLLQRHRAAEDERKVQVWLTQKGQGLRGQVLEARRHVSCRLQMSDAAAEGLKQELMGLIERLSQANARG